MSAPSGAAGPKTILIGLDAMTFDFLDPWLETGKLPNLASLAKGGARGTLESCWLPLSPPAWTNITTGRTPGSHGIFNFSTLVDDTYEIRSIDARSIRGPRLWDLANRHGLRTGAFNVPVTWPPRPVDGYMVSGFLTPDIEGTFTYPEPLGAELHALVGGYRTWTSQVFTPTHPLPYLRELRDLVRMRMQAFEHLMKERPADFVMVVFMEADWLQHKVWHALEDPAQRDTELFQAAWEVYAALDEAVGRIMELGGPDCNYVVISDHGAGLHDRAMHINKWLYDEGFLAMKRTWRLRVKRFLERRKFLLRGYRILSWLRGRMPWLGRLVPNSLAHRAIDFIASYDDVDWSRTRAYGRDALGQIYVNLKGREPCGIVEEGKPYERVLAELEERLAALPDPRTGRPVVTEMRRGREAYPGPMAREAPDLLVCLDGFRCNTSVRFGFDTDGYFGGAEFCDSGAHRRNGILMARGPAIAAGAAVQGARVEDVTPTVLHLLGLPVPDDLDGRVLAEMLAPAFRQAHPVQREGASPADAAPSQDDGLSEPEREELHTRLRDLGYL